MKGSGVSKVVKGIGSEGVWGQLGAKQCFRGQSFVGGSGLGLGLALIFVWGGALGEGGGVDFCFWGTFC